MALFIALGLLAASGVAAWAFLLNPQTGVITNVQKTITKIFVTPVSNRLSLTPNATPAPVVFPDWGKEPVNILLLGLDYRPQEQDSRSDTMIIVHVDPVAKSAAMVSIPRDLWLKIPGHGEARINAAYQLGESDTASPGALGGGPGLAMATVEDNFGVKIHYFVQVDFSGFEKIVDTLGGVTIDVAKPLADNDYPLAQNSYGSTRIYIPAGLQQMDGKTALQYARSRHADSDLGRNSRQQQVLLAIRQQGLSLNLLGHLNDLLSQLSDAVKTDLSLTQVGSLVQLSKEINKDSIQTLAIDANMVTETNIGGADVLVPNWDLIRPKVKQALANPTLAREAARLSVQNGTTTAGIGRAMQDQLEGDGFDVVSLDAAPNQGSYPHTTVTDFTGGQKPNSLQSLINLLGIDLSSVKTGDPKKAPRATTDGLPVDILVVAGDERVK
jgi:LCP family protein required for cell wall assembly